MKKSSTADVQPPMPPDDPTFRAVRAMLDSPLFQSMIQARIAMARSRNVSDETSAELFAEVLTQGAAEDTLGMRESLHVDAAFPLTDVNWYIAATTVIAILTPRA